MTVPELGNFRWLTVGVPGQPDVAITLMADTGPARSSTTRRASRSSALMAKGAYGGLFFTTDDCRATYEELKASASSSSRSRRSSPTASTPASATPWATRCVWCSESVQSPDEFRAAPVVLWMNTRRQSRGAL